MFAATWCEKRGEGRRLEKRGSERANRGIMDGIVERKRGRGGMHVGAFISVQLWRGEADAMWGSAKASAWTRSFACLLICRVVCAPQRVAARRTEGKLALCVRVPPTVGSLVVPLENVDDDANNYAYIFNARESAPSIPISPKRESFRLQKNIDEIEYIERGDRVIGLRVIHLRIFISILFCSRDAI